MASIHSCVTPELHVVPVQRAPGDTRPSWPLYRAILLLPNLDPVRLESRVFRRLKARAVEVVAQVGGPHRLRVERYGAQRRPMAEAEELFREALAVWRLRHSPNRAPAPLPAEWNAFPRRG